MVYILVSLALFGLALFAVATRAHLLRKLLALNIMGSATFLFLAAAAARLPEPFPDPVPHAMVLTGIIVAVSATAFALALIRRIHQVTGTAHLPDREDA